MVVYWERLKVTVLGFDFVASTETEFRLEDDLHFRSGSSVGRATRCNRAGRWFKSGSDLFFLCFICFFVW